MFLRTVVVAVVVDGFFIGNFGSKFEEPVIQVWYTKGVNINLAIQLLN